VEGTGLYQKDFPTAAGSGVRRSRKDKDIDVLECCREFEQRCIRGSHSVSDRCNPPLCSETLNSEDSEAKSH
jgi:hypothetical protein